MKKLCIALIAVFSINLINAQQEIAAELLEIEKEVHQLDLDEDITEAFDVDLSDYEEITDKELFDEEYEIEDTDDLSDMLDAIAEAREEGEVSEYIWDNLGLGRIFNHRIFEDGKINTDDFIGELPTGVDSGVDLGIGSEYRGKDNRIGPGGNKSEDLMNPAGNMDRGGAGSFKGVGGTDSYGTEWSVEANHFSSTHSDGSSTTTFAHHHSEVSNDNGYSSSTDKQTFKRGDGSSTTRIVVTQTQADGSSKTAVVTKTKDADGNTHSTATVTSKDADGNVTDQKTTEKEGKEDKDDDESWDPENPEGNCNKTSPPTDEEKESAVYRAMSEHGFAGSSDDDRTGNSGMQDVSGDFSPQNVQNQNGYMEEKQSGGKINVNKVLVKQQVTNPGRKN